MPPETREDRGAQGRPKLGVVIPLANEEDTVDDLMRRVLVHLTDRDRVFCVLDDVSQDSTRARLTALAASDHRIVVVLAPENRSVVDAYFRGYREALDDDCQWILEMDGGLSHLPEQIPAFLDAMASGADLAAGCRFMEGGGYRGRLARHIISRGGSWISNKVLGTRMNDMTSGFECFTAEALRYVVAHGVRSRGHFFQTEIRYLLRDWVWKEIPITYTSPSSRVPPRYLLESVVNLFKLKRDSEGSARRERAP